MDPVRKKPNERRSAKKRARRASGSPPESPEAGRGFRIPAGARALLALTGLLFAAYANIVVLGETLVATSNFHPFDYRLDHLRLSGISSPAFVNWHDQGATWWQWEPAAKFFRSAFRRARVPLWDPTIAGGVDAHVNVTQGQYFPPYVLLLLLGDTPLLRDLYYLLLLWTSGACCFFLLRRHGLHPLSGLFFGACYALGGSMTFNINSILGQSYAVIPPMLLATERLLSNPSRRAMAVAALAIAFFVLSSFMPIVLSGLMLLGLRILAELGPREGPGPAGEGVPPSASPPRRAVLAFSAGSLALGLAMAAFLVVPMKLAGDAPAFQKWYSETGLNHYRPVDSLTLVSPIISFDVWQTPDEQKHLFRKPYSWTSSFFYVGLLPLLLCGLAASPRTAGGRRLLLFFGGSSAVLFLKLMGVPPVQWIGSLPVLRHIHFIPYFCGALGFAIAGLATLGVESLVRRPPSRARVVLVALAAALVFGGILLFARFHPYNPAGNYRRYALEVGRLLVLAALLLVVLWSRSRGRLSGEIAGTLVVVLLGLELVPLAFHRRFYRHDVWSDVPDYVRFLQDDPEHARLHSVSAPTANVFQGLGLRGISSRSTFNAARYDALIRRYFKTEEVPYPLPARLLPKRRVLLDLLGVKNLIAFSPSPEETRELETAGLSLAHEDGLYKIFRNSTVWPRAALARRSVVVSLPEEALEAVGELHSPDEVVLEKAPRGALRANPGAPAGECSVREDDGDEITIETRSPDAAVLVLFDSASPGWSASVDGRPAEILTADYAFRAVEVPAGRAVVRFHYRPPGLLSSGAVSGTALLACAALLAWPRRRDQPVRASEPAP